MTWDEQRWIEDSHVALAIMASSKQHQRSGHNTERRKDNAGQPGVLPREAIRWYRRSTVMRCRCPDRPLAGLRSPLRCRPPGNPRGSRPNLFPNFSPAGVRHRRLPRRHNKVSGCTGSNETLFYGSRKSRLIRKKKVLSRRYLATRQLRGR